MAQQPNDYVEQMVKNLQKTWKEIKKQNEGQNQVIFQTADKINNATTKQLHVGQLVLKQHEGHYGKLESKWTGPYRIVQVNKPNCFIRQLNNEGKPIEVHVSKIKPFHGPFTLPLRQL
uniref:Uncharacterized protein n=1 Tax=Panagrolaimus sp. JU765 TaxID=591449 RepID=A0AC34PWW0_9BILA